MLFNSYIFIFVFLPITWVGFWGINKFKLTRLARVWLTVASFGFYAYWNIAYLPLLLISVVFNYQMGQAIANAKPDTKSSKRLLWIGIVVNLIAIGYYKYFNFFIDSINGVLKGDFPNAEVILPLAISFYTFTQIAYLVDAYRGETKHLKYDLLTYSLFVVFFPQLIAGPILRHDELIPQIRNLKKSIFSQKNFFTGCIFFGLGLSKKVLIADSLSPWVATVFSHVDEVTFIESWVGILSYTYQLYFDFSGYSDMAIGLGLMFNFNLPINFNSPYKATSISDFWRRWHMTLSNFLRDYLYIPLGGNRKGEARRYINLIVTMLLAGLWHGAGWTYVIWGGLHGIYLSVNHGWRKLNIPLPKIIAWSITFFAVITAWIIFRAASFSDGLEIFKTMMGWNGVVVPGEPTGKLAILTNFGIRVQPWNSFNYLPEFWNSKSLPFAILLVLTLCVKYLPNTQEIAYKFKPSFWLAAGVGFLTGVCLLSLNRVTEFLYFQF